MNKHFYRIFSIVLILIFLFSGCSRMEKASVFMWEVNAKDGTGKVYLLGSIHAGKEGLYPLNDIINNAYNESDVLAVECDIYNLMQKSNLSELMQKMMYTDSSTIKDHISPELYEKTDSALSKYGMSINALLKMKPFTISSIILANQMSEWGYDAENGIDMYFLKKANEDNKKIVEIESIEFQYDLLGGFPDDIQALQLESCIDGKDASKEFLDQTFDLWETGNINGMEALFLQEDETMTQEEKDAYDIYEKAMFDERNINMALKAEEYLKQGNTTFFVVGSGHMIGKNGIVQLLKDKGFKVTQK